MDINQIVEQVTSHLQDAAEKIKDVISDPKAAIEEITGQNLDDVDLGEIVEQVKTKLGETGVDVAGFIGDLGENIGGAVSGLLDNIFKKQPGSLDDPRHGAPSRARRHGEGRRRFSSIVVFAASSSSQRCRLRGIIIFATLSSSQRRHLYSSVPKDPSPPMGRTPRRTRAMLARTV